MKKQTSQGATGKNPSGYINFQSGDIKGNLQANIARNAANKGASKAFTIGSMSDQSTTVMAPSQHQTRMRANNMSFQGANFAELGAGLINDTPRSQLTVETRFRSANKPNERANARNSALIKKGHN